MRRVTNGKIVPIFALGLLSAVLVLMLSACASQATGDGNTALQPTSVLPPTVALKHSPTGSADLSWTSANHQLIVKIALTGLAPNSSHAAHIHSGRCGTSGAVVYPLNTVVANAQGVATSETTINGVQNGIPASSWYINVHNGTTMAAIDDRPIACGNISPEGNASDKQSAHTVLGPTTAPNEAASGQAQFTRQNGKIALEITLSGLEANSKHVAHIHSGTCEAQGPVVMALNPVVANAQGIGTSITLLDQIPSFANGLYINVHTGATMADLSQAALFNPIACGNL